MKLLTPVNRIESVPALCKHGAGELYVGFHDVEWEQNFGAFSNLNRMSSFGIAANPYSLEQLRMLIDVGHANHALVYITLNAESYTVAMLKKIEVYLHRMKEMSADGVIISGPAIAHLAKKAGLKPIASTMCGIYNSDIAKYYIGEGVERIILPRDLSLMEIEAIIKDAPGAEYEVFLMRSGCKFADSFCLGFHYDRFGALCQNLRRSNTTIHGGTISFRDRQLAILNETTYQTLFSSSDACGLCALFRLIRLGVAAGKIVGRATSPDKILGDLDIVSENMRIADNCDSEEEYLTRMVFPQNSDRTCFMGKSCYYPELRFDSFGGSYDRE